MKTKILKSAGVILLATMMTVASDAQNRGQYGRAFKAGNDKGAMARLELSDEQSEELTALRTEHYKSMKPLRAKMAELRATERTLLSEESVDMKEVDKVIDQQTELMNKIRKAQIRHRMEMKSVLSDEQLMKLEQRRNSPRWQGRMGRGDRAGASCEKGFGRGHGRGYDQGYGRFGQG